MLKTPREEVERLADAMREVKDRVTYCSTCSNITDVDPCFYCTDSGRDPRVICVVEEPENVGAVERTRDFKGLYHVLMGALSPLHGVGPDDLKIKDLLRRLGAGGVEEVILATNPNVEGEATAHLPREAAETARRARHAHRHGRARRERPRVRRRGDDAARDVGAKRSVNSEA